MDGRKLETENATIERRCLFRVQMPADDVPKVLEAIVDIAPLRYGNYDQVAFRSGPGILQYRPLRGSKTGEADLVHVPCDEISFSVAMQEEVVTAVIDAILASHPHEEPVILIQEVMCTRLKHGQVKDRGVREGQG